MKKQLLTLLLTVCCLSAAADEPLKYLLILANNGAKTTYALKDNPQVTFTDDALVVTKDGQETSFPKGSVQRFTYERIMPGDVNGDAKVDIVDVAKTINYLLTFTRSDFPELAADIDKSGTVDSDDVTAMIKLVLNGQEADIPASSQQATGEAFYIYRNDGQFNAFFRDEVEKMEYSNYDTDGNLHAEVESQVVYTADSIYNIPLTAIDSVGFVTPATEYKTGVIRIEGELKDYVLRQDGLNIFFSGNIPSDLIPHVGDKLVTTEMSDLFPIGFAGEVTEIKNTSGEIEVVCTPVGLEEVFECYYGYSEMEWDGKNLTRRFARDTRRKAPGTFAPGRLTLNLISEEGFQNSYQPNDELSYSLSELRGDVSVTPVVWGSAFITVRPGQGVNFSLTVTGDYNLEENFSLKGGLSWKKDFTLPYPYDRLFWPIAPLVDVYLKPGMFIQAGGEFAIQQTWTQRYRSVFHYEYSSKGEQMIENMNKLIPVSSGHSGEAALKGYIGAGFFLEVGFDFIHTKKLDLANVNLRAEAGVNLEGNLVLTKSDIESAKTSTAVYEQLRDTELSLNWFYGVTANAKFWKWGVSHDVNLPNKKLNNQGKIFTLAMAPTFSDVKAKRAEGSSNIDAEAKISCPAALGGRCIKVDAGFVLKDDEGDDASARLYSLNGYNGSQGTNEIKGQITNVPTDGKKYKVYPHIKWMGLDILASPSAELEGETSCPDENHPHWIDLGLPSGTKWRCCNEGASTPEAYGGYYTFGQVASAPSLDQIKELFNNTTSVWTTNGRKFTGPNGGTIFLPAAGCRVEGGFCNVGVWGEYWSSTPGDIEGSAYQLRFDSRGAYWGRTYRFSGQSVRPVR